MVEYIERQAVLSEYDRQHKGPPGGAREIMETYPAADVRPVVRAAWRGIGKTGRIFVCSACDKTFPYKTHFCPNCGAMMEESKE